MVKNLSAAGARRVLVGTAFPPIADPDVRAAGRLMDNRCSTAGQVLGEADAVKCDV
jgi:hypothetical protein